MVANRGACYHRAMNNSDTPSKLLWVDLEMTGLDPNTQHIIEVAAIVTDFELNEIARYDAIIHQPHEVLDGAEDWPKENMQELFEAVRTAEKNQAQIVAEMATFISEHWGEEPAILAGNSIHQDRRFIRTRWPEIERLLHYRMFDVSTLKIWVQGALGKEYEKSEKHRALGDIEESLAELKWSLEQLKQPGS